MRKVLFFLIALFLISSVSAVCTVNFDKSVYFQTETVTAEMVCSENAEKAQTYTLNWTNASLDFIEQDTGTTPNNRGEYFYETYNIPSDYTGAINATLSGTNLEGTVGANVTSASTNALIISNITIGGKWLGLSSSIEAILKDENGKKITGGSCNLHIMSNDDAQIMIDLEDIPFYGEIGGRWIMNYKDFKENVDYLLEVSCRCGAPGTILECQDEDGISVNNSVGIAEYPFTTNQWVTFNEDPLPITYANGTDRDGANFYAGTEKVYWRRNTTNNYGEELKSTVTTYLVHNDSGRIYGEPNEGSTSITERTFGIGNESTIHNHLISKYSQTNGYFVRLFFEVFYNHVPVAQYIINTGHFNVVSSLLDLKNVDTDKTNYYVGEEVKICANVSNSFNDRVEFDLFYNFRCQNPDSGDFSLDRVIIDEYLETRAVSANLSQYQCFHAKIPSSSHLLYKTSECYASVTLESPLIDTIDNKKSVTSPSFNVTDIGLFLDVEDNPAYPLIRVTPDWRRFDDFIDNVSRSYYRAKINISQIEEDYLDPTNIIVDNDWDIYVVFSDKMPCSTNIYNYTAINSSGGIADNSLENKEKAHLEADGNLHYECAVGIENVNFSDPKDDYFELKVWFEDFEERQTKALEGVENKTGTFHLDVDCPSEAIIGEDMECIITAYIEDPQVVQKEVDFTCGISDGINTFSSLNFNQMITKNPLSINRSFLVPSTFTARTQYVLQCTADYYNFGSRRDSFYDTFVAIIAPSVGGGVGLGRITGAIIEAIFGDKEDKEKPEEEEEPFIPIKKQKLAWIFVLGILIVGSVVVALTIKKKRKYYPNKSLKINWKKLFRILLVLFAIIAGILASISLGYILIKKIFFSKIISLEYSFIQDPLFRGMILVAFIVSMIIILFKTLPINMEIKLGRNFSRRNYEDSKVSKMQRELNRLTLKHEIKQARRNK